jgi:hypothetical protein
LGSTPPHSTWSNRFEHGVIRRIGQIADQIEGVGRIKLRGGLLPRFVPGKAQVLDRGRAEAELTGQTWPAQRSRWQLKKLKVSVFIEFPPSQNKLKVLRM